MHLIFFTCSQSSRSLLYARLVTFIFVSRTAISLLTDPRVGLRRRDKGYGDLKAHIFGGPANLVSATICGCENWQFFFWTMG